MRKIWGSGRRISAPIGVEAPKIEEVGEKKKHRMIRVPVRAKHPLIMLIIGCFIITIFIIALDYIIMPDMAVDSLFYHWQIKIVGYLFGTDTGIPRLLWPVVIGIIAVVGYRLVPKMTLFEGNRTHTIYYNPLKHTGDSETETITAIWGGKKYKVDKNFIKSHGLNLFIVGNVSRNSMAKETGVILLQTKDIEITRSEEKDTIIKMLRSKLLKIEKALETGEDREAILSYFKRQTEYPYQYRPPYQPPTGG